MINADSVVVVDEITTASKDYKIGRLTLNKPKVAHLLIRAAVA